MSRANLPPSPDGFTLIEMLVALSVFALAALAMVNLQGYSVRTASTLSDSALAQQVAQNLLVERLSAPLAPTIGTEQGLETNGGRSWQWQVTTAKTEDTRLVTIAVTVTGSGAEAKRTARLSAARLVEQ
jgi:general secretion pathway protein I